MNGAPFRHIGGMVVADHGALGLRAARGLASFYECEGHHWRSIGAVGAGQACRVRSVALKTAIAQAEAWRRAAGWYDPNDADHQAPG